MKNKNQMERLPDSELAVMRLIWKAKEPVGSGKLAEILGNERGWSRSTIQVLLARLEEKNFVSYEKQGRCKFYVPLIEEKFYLKAETKNFLEQFYDNSYKNLIASLVQEEELTKEDMEEIMDIIRQGNGREFG